MAKKDLPWFAQPWFSVLIAIVVLLLFLGAAIIVLTKGGGINSGSTPAIATLIGLFTPVLGILVLILRQQFNIDQLNGHIAEHQNGGS